MNTEGDHGQQANGTNPTAEQDNSSPGNDNVDRIRHILFGSQMRDYEERFQQLAGRLEKEITGLRTELQKQIEANETFLKAETESLSNRVKAEQSERSHAIEKLLGSLAETAKGLELRIGNLDEQATKDIRDLRQKLFDQSKALSAEIKDSHEQSQNRLESEARLIRSAMTGRESLAEMLTEIALRLKGEFHVPGGPQ